MRNVVDLLTLSTWANDEHAFAGVETPRESREGAIEIGKNALEMKSSNSRHGVG